MRYALYRNDLERPAARIVSRYGISRLAADTLIEQYLDLAVLAEPDLWNERTNAFTPEGRLDVLARLNFYTDPIAGNVPGAQDPLLNAINTAALMNREYEAARNDLIRLAMSTKTIDRSEIAAAALMKEARLYQIAGPKNGPIGVPRTFDELDVREPFRIGQYITDGLPTVINLHRDTTTLVSAIAAGRIDFLHLLTLMVGRCQNALAWHIDLSPLSMSVPWLTQYAHGLVDRPVVDWAADSLNEALLMMQEAKKLLYDRKRRFAGRLASRNIDRLDVDRDAPEVVIMVEQGNQALVEMGEPGRKLAGLIEDVRRMGYSWGVQVLSSSWRGTADYVSPRMRKLGDLTVSGPVGDEDELAVLFGYNQGLRSDMLTDPDMLFIAGRTDQPALFRRFSVTAADISVATVAVQGIRGKVQLDEPEPRSTVYAERWTRPHQALMLSML